jgi:carbon-monoxide dehydrogenase medium subunit
VKPAPFEYVAPSTIDDALEALASSEDARLLAGGQSLVPLMNLRLARPDLVVDLNPVAELDYIEIVDESLRIGALTRHRRLELDPIVAADAPLIAEAASNVGHASIRNRATLGGSLAHADPSAELGAALVALNGVVVVAGPHGRREIPASELYEGYFTTTIETGELLVEVQVPRRAQRVGHAFREFAPRHGDYAVAGLAAVVTLDNSKCSSVRLAGCGLGVTPLDLTACADVAIGAPELSDDLLRTVATEVAALVQPTSDVHASGEYRTELAQILAVDALRAAWAYAAQEED